MPVEYLFGDAEDDVLSELCAEANGTPFGLPYTVKFERLDSQFLRRGWRVP